MIKNNIMKIINIDTSYSLRIVLTADNTSTDEEYLLHLEIDHGVGKMHNNPPIFFKIRYSY